MQAAGYSPACLDLAVEAFDPARIARARLVVISAPMHTALRLGLALLPRLAAVNPRAPVVFQGLYAQLQRDLLFSRGASAVTAGECEETIVALARALESGRELASVAGLSLPGRPAAPLLAKLRFPVADRRGLPPLSVYAKLDPGDGKLVPAAYAEASRGCKYRCRHCPIPPIYGGRFFVVPRASVLEDVEAQVASGARHVTFGDPDFWNGPGHTEAIVRELHRRHPDVTYDATIKIEHLLRHRARIPMLVATGCAFVTTAVESLDDAVLARLDKGHTRAGVEEAFDLCEEAGLPLRPTFVAFTPWTTAEGFGDILRFVERRGLAARVDPVQYALRLLVPPGSALLTGALPGLRPPREEGLSYEWIHPDARIDALQQRLWALAKEARRDGRGRADTFARIRDLTSETLGLSLARRPVPRRRGHVPSLTESWFC